MIFLREPIFTKSGQIYSGLRCITGEYIQAKSFKCAKFHIHDLVDDSKID